MSSSPPARVASPLHVVHCFDAVRERLGHSVHPKVPLQSNGDKFPLFVTWKKRHPKDGEWKLRGCIGTFGAKELSKGLREYAAIAAFEDTRFTPILAEELAHLQCGISLLTNFEVLAPGDLFNWTVGTHGIQIDFVDPSQPRRSHSATFLPEVAHEQGWTHQETIDALIHKSGYRGMLTPALQRQIKITRYQSEKQALTYDEYLALRQAIANGTSHPLLLASAAVVAPAAAPSASPEEDDFDDDEDKFSDDE